MKKLLAATLIMFALGAPSSLASDTELETWCNAFADSNGVPRTPCACIVAALSDNAALKAEMMSMETIAEYRSTGSAALREKVDPCVPPPPH